MRLSKLQSGRFVLTVDSNADALDNSAVGAARHVAAATTADPLAAAIVKNNMAQTVDDNHTAMSDIVNNKRIADQGDWRRQHKLVLERMGVVMEEDGGDQSLE